MSSEPWPNSRPIVGAKSLPDADGSIRFHGAADRARSPVGGQPCALDPSTTGDGPPAAKQTFDCNEAGQFPPARLRPSQPRPSVRRLLRPPPTRPLARFGRDHGARYLSSRGLWRFPSAVRLRANPGPGRQSALCRTRAFASAPLSRRARGPRPNIIARAAPAIKGGPRPAEGGRTA